jgi:hypothetical protein
MLTVAILAALTCVIYHASQFTANA